VEEGCAYHSTVVLDRTILVDRVIEFAVTLGYRYLNDAKCSYLSVRTAPSTLRSFALSLVPLVA
jgi:hypothetical protein